MLNMIDVSGGSVVVKLLLLITPFLLLVVGLVVNAYIAGSRHFHVMCRAFGRSSGLQDELVLWGTTRLRSRMLIVSAMSLAAVWPSHGFRRGWLDANDWQDFPEYLKCCMKVSSYCLFIGLGMLFLLVSFVRVVP